MTRGQERSGDAGQKPAEAAREPQAGTGGDRAVRVFLDPRGPVGQTAPSLPRVGAAGMCAGLWSKAEASGPGGHGPGRARKDAGKQAPSLVKGKCYLPDSGARTDHWI